MSVKQKCIEWVKNQVENHRYNGRKNGYINYYKRIIQRHPELGQPAEGEEEWLNYWRRYDAKLSPLAFRVFSRYVGNDVHIMPMELCVNIVELILTTPQYRGFYRNKNSLNLLMTEGTTVKTIVRKMVGFYYDHRYQPLNMDETTLRKLLTPYDKVLFKPAMEDSGRGIQLFERKGAGLFNRQGEELTASYLLHIQSDDFQIQECIEQSDFTASFNPTSVNSFRIMTYRSVTDGTIHVPNLFFKIGGKGQVVDNAHGGGVMCGVDRHGKLMNYTYNYLGDRFDHCFDIDIKNGNFVVPNFEGLISFAKEVAGHVLHHHLLSLDVALDNNNTPVLIEVNSEANAGWAYQMSTGSLFGVHTDEVMEYCYKRFIQYKTR